MTSVDHFWAVIPAGGAGTRLWPLSRAGAPKFLHDLTGSGRSLLQATVDRLGPLADDRILVVTGAAHLPAVARQLPDVTDAHLLAEPTPRDSMAAIGLAAALLEREDPDAVMGSFAADHVIPDGAAFGACVRDAIAAAEAGWLVTLGIEPTYAATGFGYIHVGEAMEDVPAFHVKEFVEKPSAPVATQYVDSGDYRWNAGMFVVRPTVLLDLLAENDPGFAADLRAIAAGGEEAMARLWPTLPKIALDHAVAEPAAAAGRIAVVPGAFDWEDIGDFASLGDLLDPDASSGALTVLGDESLVHARSSSGLVIPGGGRFVAVLGLDDIVVVDTPDAVLVASRDHAQDVKAVVSALKDAGRTDLV
ncbi:mannose-1-phosphate guanylyltransferase [Nocardioides jejuensis]|uniref:Mannose-1-phosphate guanylyltransferase n=1 Tax=Nocardioides jejuensis TaxID=2502782 RepID=A0A4R1BWP6_9ACTN|nr:sugar phosphate nucleotidyltransferase [Nocardioides jejuensis]TCJ22439.1 mannose-1-phosphate guanylyltransferase [Nocardioides jejuensis]